MARECMNNDITLNVSGEEFMANKAIISEKSDFFKAMFSSGMLESESRQVEIAGISSKGFGDILRYMHGLEFELDMENVFDILAIAIYIEINEVIKLCKEFLMSNIDVKNCNTVANFAECYSFLGLKEHVLNFIDENFWDISQTEYFYNMPPELIHHAVKADKVVNFSELDLLEAVLQWGLKPSNLTIGEKLKHMEDMLDHVRFYEISKKELNERLKIIFSENSAIHLIHEKITKLSMLPSNSLRTKFSTRGLKKAILKVYTRVDTPEKLAINFINDTKWIELTEFSLPDNIDKLCRWWNPNCKGVVVNNEFYTIINADASSVVIKFLDKINKWKIIDRMNVERRDYSICEVDDKIYVVGGLIRSGQNVVIFEPTNTALSYNLLMKTCRCIASLPQPRTHHASVNCANILYISGGKINLQGDASMLKYNPLTNTWLSCAPLLSPRYNHTMITYGDKIYVCGGRRAPGGRGNRDIEEYDVANDSWRFVTTLQGYLPIIAATIVESKIYILEVYNNFHTEFYEIKCYDVETNEWSIELKEKKYSENIWTYGYHTMYLPKSLADDR